MTKSFGNYLDSLSKTRLKDLVLEANEFCDKGTTEDDSDIRFLAREFYGGELPHHFLSLTHDIFRYVATQYVTSK
jgi:hypothetical protein